MRRCRPAPIPIYTASDKARLECDTPFRLTTLWGILVIASLLKLSPTMLIAYTPQRRKAKRKCNIYFASYKVLEFATGTRELEVLTLRVGVILETLKTCSLFNPMFFTLTPSSSPWTMPCVCCMRVRVDGQREREMCPVRMGRTERISRRERETK